MALKDQTAVRVVLYEGDGAQSFEASDRFTAMTALLESGFAVSRATGQGSVAPADRTSLLVIGKCEGPAPNGEDANGSVSIRFANITGLDVPRIVETVEAERAQRSAAKHGDWKTR